MYSRYLGVCKDIGTGLFVDVLTLRKRTDGCGDLYTGLFLACPLRCFLDDTDVAVLTVELGVKYFSPTVLMSQKFALVSRRLFAVALPRGVALQCGGIAEVASVPVARRFVQRTANQTVQSKTMYIVCYCVCECLKYYL